MDNGARMNTTMTTGFEQLDRFSGGLKKRTLMLIVSQDAAAGKAFILSAIRHAALTAPAAPTLYFSQNRGHRAVERLIACESGLDAEVLTSGSFKVSDWARITNVAARIAEAPLCIVESAHDIEAIRNASTDWLDRLRRGGQPPGLVVFDNIQDIRPTPVDACEALQDADSLALEAIESIEYAHLWAQSRDGAVDSAPARVAFLLKELAIRIDVPVIAHCHLHCAQSDPAKREAAFSSALAAFAKAADIVGCLELLRRARHTPRAKISVTENIFGATGGLYLAYYPDSFQLADTPEREPVRRPPYA